MKNGVVQLFFVKHIFFCRIFANKAFLNFFCCLKKMKIVSGCESKTNVQTNSPHYQQIGSLETENVI
jgi:hypothetical protein